MEIELLNAAQEGSVETLLKLLHQDQLILRRYISGGFKETPLHVAAMFGHLEFTNSLICHMPEMAKELDNRKSTPLHVATANGHILVVKALLSVNPEMCFAKDWEGKNPVHMAVIKGHTEILKELVLSRPQAALALLGASTILHLCVKYYQVGALKFILDVFPNDTEFVNSKDEEGFTILHLAVAERQTEVVKFLLQHHKVDVNATNAYGFTALGISLAHGRKKIEDIEVAECFQQARELGAKSTTGSNVAADSSSNETSLKSALSKDAVEPTKLQKKREKKKKKRLDDSCNTMMIVASLIATMSFQALMNPTTDVKEKKFRFWSNAFLIVNTASFCLSIGTILLLISGLPLKHRLPIRVLKILMWISVLANALTYFCVTAIVSDVVPHDTRKLNYPVWIVVLSVSLLIIIVMLGHAIQMLVKIVKCICRCMKRGRGTANSNAQNQSNV